MMNPALDKEAHMADFSQTGGWGGLRFFGRITASISHELKNSLSIMNENAGLLQDLAGLAEQRGGGLDTDRVKSLSSSVGRQVKRTDAIIRNMNKFAHSVDSEIKTFDLGEYLDLMAAVSARLLAARGVKVKVTPETGPVSLTTSPFLLLYTVWHLLDCCSERPDQEKTLDLRFGRFEGIVSIHFKGCMNLEPELVSRVTEGDMRALLRVLGAGIETDARPHTIGLYFQGTPPGG
jgi:hypothetical protein